MGSVIKSYAKPKTAAALARSIMLFMEEELGLVLDRDEQWFTLADWGGRFETEVKWGGCTVVVQGELRRGAAWEEITADRRRLIHAWERAGKPEVDFSELVYPLGEGEGPASFCAVEKYRKPTNKAELAATVRAFLANEFGFSVGGVADDDDNLEVDLATEGGEDYHYLAFSTADEMRAALDVDDVSNIGDEPAAVGESFEPAVN